ncbi:MAG: fibrobacter succinogenes major paralogous domain-containing protein, partial [Fibrobacteria bacterium]|nr:fibrobacter succinogenes major paralogous domain-containing protein [Fibrobacteria bacterium]
YWALDGEEYNDSTSERSIKTAFSDSGMYAVLVKVRDDDGVFSVSDEVRITVITNPPTVVAMDDVGVSIHDTVTITAVGKDTNGTIETYYWALDGEEYNDSTSERSIKTAFSDSGSYTVLVKVRDDDGVFSLDDSLVITAYLGAPVLKSENDTIVSQTDTVRISVTAVDTNSGGSIEKYYWDRNADGWDDSTDVPQFYFSMLEGGGITAVWGARDDDGVISTDTFSILFNRQPASVSMTTPANGDTAEWAAFSSSTGKGSVQLAFTASDPDGVADALTYTLCLGKVQGSLSQIYSGKNDSAIAQNLDTSTTYFWKLVGRDLYGDSAVGNGSFISLPPPPPCTPQNPYFTDVRDNRQYRCVEIGLQVWMAENLNYIPSSGTFWCYGGNSSNCDTYGRLYDWNVAVADNHGNGKDICPLGWHLPADGEWTTLENEVGGRSVAGKKMKAVSFNGTDGFGFTALPAGHRQNDGMFGDLGSSTYFWTTTGDADADRAWHRYLYSGYDDVSRNYRSSKYVGYSCRCLQD